MFWRDGSTKQGINNEQESEFGNCLYGCQSRPGVPDTRARPQNLPEYKLRGPGTPGNNFRPQEKSKRSIKPGGSLNHDPVHGRSPIFPRAGPLNIEADLLTLPGKQFGQFAE